MERLLSWIRRFTTVKMITQLFYQKPIYRQNIILIKIPLPFIIKKKEENLKIHLQTKNLQIDKSGWGKGTVSKDWKNHHIQCNFKLSYRTINTSTVWLWHKNRHVDQQCRRCSHKPIQLLLSGSFYCDTKYSCWRKDCLFDKGCWEKWVSTCTRLKLDPNLSHCTKINSQCFEVDNVPFSHVEKPVAVKSLAKEAGKTFEDKDITKDF